MKIFGKIVAALVAGVVSVLAVQLLIRRIYRSFGGRYFEIPVDNNDRRPSPGA